MFVTPKGVPVVIQCRSQSNDYNTAFSALNEDEYGLRDLDLSGLAIDIGGHIGTVTVALAVDNPDLHVIALEPIPENLVLLRRNVEANGVAARVTVVEGMAGIAGQGLIRYGWKGNETALHHAYIGNSTLAVPEGEHTVIRPPVYGLAELLEAADQDPADHVRLLKIDAEGGEYAFFEASADFLDRVELIRMEWHPNGPDNGHHTKQDIVDLLAPTHDLTFSGPEGGPGGVSAVRR
jgi:FkbM family methyltransferase